jgi:cytochrome c553
MAARAITALLFVLAIALPAHAAPPVVDTMAQRVLACTTCHGAQGRASAEGYVPRIAGKPAGYLHQQLLAFRDGRRRHDGMARLLEHLDDAYLAEIAAHFAALELPYAPAPGRPPGYPAELLQRGATLALRGDASRQLPACNSCHGAALMGIAPDLPGLLGLPKDYVLGQLGGWRVGARRARAPDCMAQIARRLTPDDVAAVASWLQAQPMPAVTAPELGFVGAWPMDCGSVRP